MRASYFVTAMLAASLLSCSSGEKIEPPHTYQLGDRVPVGHLIYTVLEKDWANQFGQGTDARIPQNKFYQLKLTVVNSGSRDVGDVIIPNTQLVDDSGTDYPEAADGEGVKDWIGNTRQVRPNETLRGSLLFDVQPKHYKLRLYSEDEKQIAFVDLPLSFDSNTPDAITDPDAVTRAIEGSKKK